MRNPVLLAATIAALVLLAGCKGGGEDVRPVAITISDVGCTPPAIEAQPGQRLRLDISNDSEQLYLVSGAEGGVEPLGVEPGKNAEAFYKVPQGAASYSITCTSAEGAKSLITLNATLPTTSADLSNGPTRQTSDPTPAPDAADTTLAVTLVEYTVTTSAQRLSPGRANIIATNISGEQAHELNVLQLQPDGSFQDIGEIAPIAPQQGGSILVNLLPGTYRLACMIGIGESGSTVDHYQQGMWTDVIVDQ